VVLYWDRLITASGSSDAPSDYNQVESFVDPALFDPVAQAIADDTTTSGLAATGLQLKKIYCRWLQITGVLPEEVLKDGVSDLCFRIFREVTQPHPVVSCDVQLKDSGLKVGDVVDLVTDELLNPDGTDATVRCLIIRKEPKGANIGLKLQRVNTRRFMAVAPAELAGLDWSDATQEEREYGFIADQNGRLSDDSFGFYLW
jgi:hypothetical protein